MTQYSNENRKDETGINVDFESLKKQMMVDSESSKRTLIGAHENLSETNSKLNTLKEKVYLLKRKLDRVDNTDYEEKEKVDYMNKEKHNNIVDLFYESSISMNFKIEYSLQKIEDIIDMIE